MLPSPQIIRTAARGSPTATPPSSTTSLQPPRPARSPSHPSRSFPTGPVAAGNSRPPMHWTLLLRQKAMSLLHLPPSLYQQVSEILQIRSLRSAQTLPLSRDSLPFPYQQALGPLSTSPHSPLPPSPSRGLLFPGVVLCPLDSMLVSRFSVSIAQPQPLARKAGQSLQRAPLRLGWSTSKTAAAAAQGRATATCVYACG